MLETLGNGQSKILYLFLIDFVRCSDIVFLTYKIKFQISN